VELLKNITDISVHEHLHFYSKIVKEYYIKSGHLICKYLPLNTGTEISEYIIIQFNIFEVGIYYFPNAIFKNISYTLTWNEEKFHTHAHHVSQ